MLFRSRPLWFEVIEFGGRNVVLSRRSIVEAERRERNEALKLVLHEGDRVKGTVTSLQKFGAFVDIGGVEGLLPVSELAWGRTEKTSDVLSVGQPVEVQIKRLDWENERISLSLKDILPNPWDTAAISWPVGSYQKGRVSRLTTFGAFISLGDGVDGLIHVSRLGNGEKRIGHPEEVLKAGQEIEVRVESVDSVAKKISLAPADVSRAEDEHAETMAKYRGQDTDTNSSLGSLGETLKKALEQKGKI